MSVLSLRPVTPSLLLAGVLLCRTAQAASALETTQGWPEAVPMAAEAPAPAPLWAPNEQSKAAPMASEGLQARQALPSAAPVQGEGLQAVRILVSSAVGLMPLIQPRSFETAPAEHPWVMWLPEANIQSSWYQKRGTDNAVKVLPYILNGGARSAASAGFVFGLSY